MTDNTISESAVLNRLQAVTVLDKGRADEQERADGIYEVSWWDIPAEDADGVRNLAAYDNVDFGAKNPSSGSQMDDTVRLSVATCIIPVPPNELAAHEMDQYDEDREQYLRERYENDN